MNGRLHPDVIAGPARAAHKDTIKGQNEAAEWHHGDDNFVAIHKNNP